MQRGFTKLFNTIVTSTIWSEDDKTRIVWITMLAIADQCGVVSGSIPGIADIARVSLMACKAAIGKLEGPDEYSRSQEQDGRRIEKVDGGWRIINYAKYRNMLNAEERREYKARWIAEKRRQTSTNVENGRPESTKSTQAEAEADKKKRHAKRAPLVDSDWIADLKTQPAYKNLDVDKLLSRMQNWCKVRDLKPTRRRFINWLNKEDKPIAHTPARPIYGNNRLPPPNESLSAEEMQRLRDAARTETEALRKKLNPSLAANELTK